VEYRQFAKLYEFLSNLEARFDQHFSLVMITLESAPGTEAQLEELERAMFCMEQAVRGTVRNVDILTRYSRQQFLVLMTGTGPEGVRIAVERIFRDYYKMNGIGNLEPSWALAEPRENGEQEAAARA